MENRFIPGDLVEFQNEVVKIVHKEGLIYAINIEPIRLTPKILEENNWYQPNKLNQPSLWIHEDGSLALRHSKVATQAYADPFNKEGSPQYSIGGSFKYVHELQHLLFGLGLKSDMEV